MDKVIDVKNEIQKSIDQIGLSGVQQYLPKGMKLYPCELHGMYLSHYSSQDPICPLCVSHSPEAEGTTATQVEHYIDMRDGINPYTDHDGF